jgi:hypothetical protein
MSKLFSICFLILVLSASGQDTLFKRNGERVPAKILEVNNIEVSYNRFDMLDGPLFKIAKNDVSKIKYVNGALDSFTVIKQNASSVIKEPLTIIFRNRWGYKYDNHRLSEKEILSMTFEKNKTFNNLEIVSQTKAYKKNKLRQFAVGLGGVAVGAGMLGVAQGYMNVHEGEANFDPLLFTSIACAGIVVIPTSIMSRRYKKKRRTNIHNLAELYNQLVKVQ